MRIANIRLDQTVCGKIENENGKAFPGGGFDGKVQVQYEFFEGEGLM